MNKVGANYIALMIYIVSLQKAETQVCTDTGRIVGLDAIERIHSDYAIDHTIILHVYGGINCYGVVTYHVFTAGLVRVGPGIEIECTKFTVELPNDVQVHYVSTFLDVIPQVPPWRVFIQEWKFFKTSSCSDVYFQIWRPNDTNFVLTGQNFYDEAIEKCPRAEGEVILRIPAHEQIPVEPGDVIGWTQNAGTDMIQFEDGDPSQVVTEVCKSTDATEIGTNTLNCSDATTLDIEVSLQLTVVTGPAPVFNNLPNVVEIPENSKPGDPVDYPEHTYFDVKASIETNVVDGNIARDVPLSFSFVTDQPKFKISTQPKDGNLPYTGRVEITEHLDYETQQEHILPIRVDGLGQFCESTLTVHVIDINEPHTITNLPQDTTVSAETARAGDIVFQVQVYDDDANPDPLLYAIDSTDVLDPAPPFAMDNKTGILRVSEDLYGGVWADRYVLDLVAWDYMYKAVEKLTIHLTDIRSDPVIHNLDETIDVPEDAPTGSDIFQVVAEGRYPNELVYKITGVTPFEMYNKFVIDARSGWISTTSDPEFNYGITNVIEISIEVTDDVGSDDGLLTINLQWVNRAPVFAPEIYKTDIPEKCGEERNPGNCRNPVDDSDTDAELPWTIPGLGLMFNHRDEDYSVGSDYSSCSVMDGFASTLFRVANCSTIEVLECIDVNKNPELMSINLTIKIEDRYGLSDTALVFITVYDINDHHPVFNPTTYEETVSENEKGGRSILQVSATDDDFGENATIRYSLRDVSGYNGSFYFQIHPMSGVIYTKHPIDYELLMRETSDNSIVFRAIATDGGALQNTDQATVTITVTDVNDNRPVFDCESNRGELSFQDPSNPCFYNLDLRGDSLVGLTILNLTAYDVKPHDLEPEYYLLNPKEHFALETTADKKGHLHTISPLYTYHKYDMICMVVDQGQPKLKARPPTIVRLDTFHAKDHLVDITLDPEEENINCKNENLEFKTFMINMTFFISPWFPRFYGCSEEVDRYVVTIYALEDNSTFLYDNLDQPKKFVHVNDLLRKLRKNVFGDPRDDFKEEFNRANPVLVMPRIPHWWIHTIPGLLTAFFLCLILLLIIILVIVACCTHYGLCCCKSKRKLPTKHAWMKDDRYKQHETDTGSVREYDDSSDDDNKANSHLPTNHAWMKDDRYMQDSDDDGSVNDGTSEISKSSGIQANSDMRRQNSGGSRPSTSSTLHSKIYPMKF